jgi:hypothetical protein
VSAGWRQRPLGNHPRVAVTDGAVGLEHAQRQLAGWLGLVHEISLHAGQAQVLAVTCAAVCCATAACSAQACSAAACSAAARSAATCSAQACSAAA